MIYVNDAIVATTTAAPSVRHGSLCFSDDAEMTSRRQWATPTSRSLTLIKVVTFSEQGRPFSFFFLMLRSNDPTTCCVLQEAYTASAWCFTFMHELMHRFGWARRAQRSRQCAGAKDARSTMGILCLLSDLPMHEMAIKGANEHCPCTTKHILNTRKSDEDGSGCPFA